MSWLAWVFLFAFRMVATVLLALLGFLFALLATTLFIGTVFIVPASDIKNPEHRVIEQNAIALAPGEFERLRDAPMTPNYERILEGDNHYEIYFRNEFYPSYLFHRREGQAYVTPLPFGYDYPCPVVVTLGVICSGMATSYHKDYGLRLIDHKPFVYSLAEGLQRDSQGYFLPEARGYTGWAILVLLALLAAVIFATRRLFPLRA
jgi:hypothetical protein